MLILPVVVAAACLWMAKPQELTTSTVRNPTTVVSQSRSIEQGNGSVKFAADAMLTSLPVSSPELITRPIEDIRPGMRVLASNPEQSEDSQRLSFHNELDWRLVKYRMAKADGSWLHIDQLEPAADVTGVVAQMRVELSYPELAIEGPADVISIQACPAITSGSGEVVTATFHHTAANVINLYIAGEPAPIGTTSNHPFWSEDRFDWVQAGDLQPGEHLRLIDGTLTTVDAITRNPEKQAVYNLTVNALHTYHVGESGVLVHNSSQYAATSLFRNALQRFNTGGLTNAGRALSKHPSMVNLTKQTFNQTLRAVASQNKAASEFLKELMRSNAGNVVSNQRWGQVFEIRNAVGQGARWRLDGTFIGFVD